MYILDTIKIHPQKHRATLIYRVLSCVTLPPLQRGQLLANKQPTLRDINLSAGRLVRKFK